MKKIMVLTFLTVLTLGMRAADYNYLVFTLNDNTTQAISASYLNITFSNGSLIATSGSETVTIELTKLTKMAFSNDNATGIQTIESAAVTIDSATEIYDLNGRRLPNGSQLSRGIYVIKSNGKTSKVQIK